MKLTQALKNDVTDIYMIEDKALMERIIKGDNSAFSILSDRHLSRVIAHAYRIIGSLEYAEDVAQDVFIKIWKKAHLWDHNKAKFTTWIYQITYNQSIDYIRKNKRETTLDSVDEKILSYDQDTLQKIEKDEQKKMLMRRIERLPKRSKQALILCYFEDCSYKEAAQIMEISLSALESLLARARKTLKNEFINQE